LETPTKTGEIAEFDGRLAGQNAGAVMAPFPLRGTITKAGGCLFDKTLTGGTEKWDGMFMPNGHLYLTNSAGNNMEYKVPHKSLWGSVFKSGAKRYYCQGKGERFDDHKKKYGDYEVVFCIDNPQGNKWSITTCLRCKYTIVVSGKNGNLPIGQFLYQDLNGTLTVGGENATVELGTDPKSDQPWKGTWKLGKGHMNLKTTKGAEVKIHVDEFFQKPPFVFDTTMSEPSASRHIGSDILNWNDHKAVLGHYDGTINFRELPKVEAHGECAVFDGRLHGKQGSTNFDFHIDGKVTKAGAMIIDKKHPEIGAWEGMIFPDGRISMYNSGRNFMNYKVPKKAVWGPIFKAGKERWYCLAKADRCDEKKHPYGEYDGVFVLDNPKGNVWEVTMAIKCTYKIKVINCEVGQHLYHHAQGKLTIAGAVGTLEVGNDKNMGQPWKGTWKVGTKEPIDLKTATGADVIFKMSEFFNTAPAHEHNVNEAMS